MSDELIRAGVGDLPVAEFESPAFTIPPPLNEARVAVVTTAGLRRTGDPTWNPEDSSFRSFATDERGISLGHLSSNFDRSGFVVGPNVVYTVDRLKEMAGEGIIGSVASHHLSCMGAQQEPLATLGLDTGPAAAKQLKDDGVNVVLLTPV